MVFRLWKDLLRIVFLLAVHIGMLIIWTSVPFYHSVHMISPGTVVPFTLFNLRSSCNIFSTSPADRPYAIAIN